ncbi:hypothetical protein TSUD_46040 [Trifolium subterraneum]|nr:hypothetical protein TSUD_46040 [Trifolium subterraneum]
MRETSDNHNVKEGAKRVRRKKNATGNGDLHMNGRKNRERSDNLDVKEVAKKVRRRKSTEKNTLENGDLHMNGRKMRRNEKMKSGEEAVVMKIPKKGQG